MTLEVWTRVVDEISDKYAPRFASLCSGSFTPETLDQAIKEFRDAAREYEILNKIYYEENPGERRD